MALHRRKFRTAHVDQLAAVFAFAVKIRFRAVPFFAAGVFETGGTVGVDDVFVDDALFDHVFEPAVYRRRTDRFTVRFKIRTDRMHRNVRAFHRFQKCEQFFVLFCFVLTFRIHTRNSQNENDSHFTEFRKMLSRRGSGGFSCTRTAVCMHGNVRMATDIFLKNKKEAEASFFHVMIFTFY